ncbi:hypothetical protein QBC46DRAFT_272952 [Diplogelasinospora grovesii]|uniref:Uncharacterized protein n=1 Tax=Diplogelasinospora grovesii TaxID=303347 RepID=A0AAN6MYL1_9PEZI|nr:hypothetical protein QBC46DRAFT_272952 [Diplogelasinospora grovesii]
MAASAQHVIYGKQSDWDAWKNQFLRRAKDLRLWTYIDLESSTKWLIELIEPDIDDYPKRASTASSRLATRLIGSSAGSSTTMQAGSHNPDELPTVPTLTLDLTDNGRNAYNDSINIYKEHKADYRRFESNREKLTS